MENVETRSPSKAAFWIGWILCILPALGLLFSGAAKLLVPVTPELEESLNHIGWRANLIPVLAILEFVCAILFLIPQTALLGAILVTGYMGGAIATHLRVGDPFVVQALFPILCWLGLWLRDPRLRVLLPLRS